MLLRVLKVIRLLRLMRVARLYRYFARYEMHFSFMNSNVLRLLKVICVMAFFAHWNGCFQYLLATFEANVLSDGSLEFRQPAGSHECRRTGLWMSGRLVMVLLHRGHADVGDQHRLEAAEGRLLDAHLRTPRRVPLRLLRRLLTTAISEADASAKTSNEVRHGQPVHEAFTSTSR